MGADDKPTVDDGPASTRPDRPSSQPDQVPTAIDRPATAPKRSGRRSVPPQHRYESGDEIGRGGMGRVVEATDTLLDRVVAVKEALTTDAELLRRFARETKITARLEHPSIVPVYDAGTVDGAPYYVMRRVSGRPLSELIKSAPSLAERLALVPHLLAAAQAIAHAHKRGIIHRDIKPSNILVGELGETVVIDWGLAKVIGEPDDESSGIEPGAGVSLRTRIGAVFGTPGFMAPDQLRGDPVGPTSDVYALGACLYNLLAGKPPHYSDDSTQMMKLASQGPPAPIARVVPGVPAELSTIVDTALDYDAQRRYRDAGAFAEELKRFLAGQLVASHRYSRREHLVRFIRRHRGAVAIGAAAMVLVVVIGAIAVWRVVEARDRADEQAQLATQGRREAEAARAMADERAEELLLSRARALVDTNPSAAVASLKQLPPKSKRSEEARAIAAAAQLRGVAWGMRGIDALTATAMLDHAGTHLAQVTLDGKVHVWDLEARQLAFEVSTGRGAQVHFLPDDKLLINAPEKTRIFDAQGVEQRTTLPSIGNLEVDEHGDAGVGVDADGHAVRFDLEHFTTTVLPGTNVSDVTISPDGTWCAITTPTELTIIDRAGTPIMRRPHQRSILRVALSEQRVAAIDDTVVIQAAIGPDATWTQLKGVSAPNHRPVWVRYLEDELVAVYTDGRVVVNRSGELFREIGRMETTNAGIAQFGANFMSVGSDGRTIFYTDGSRMLSVQLPMVLRYVRVVGRLHAPRLVAIGEGVLIVLELAHLPRLLPTPNYSSALFVTEKTALSSNSLHHSFVWHDLDTGKSAWFPDIIVGNTPPIYSRDGRLAVVEVADDKLAVRIFHAGETQWRESIDEPFEHLQLVSNGVVFSIGNAVYDGADRRELFRLDGQVEIIARTGNQTGFVAASDRELVAARLGDPKIRRIALPTGPRVSFVTWVDDDVVIARGGQILRWRDSGIAELTHFATDVEAMLGVPHGFVTTLVDGSTFFVDTQGTPTRLVSTRGVVLVSDTRVIVPGQAVYEVIELPSLARWSIPIPVGRNPVESTIDISPSGARLIEKAVDGHIWVWSLPSTTDSLAQRLASTNLVEDKNGLLMWPWQAPDGK